MTKVLRESGYIFYPFLVLLPAAGGFYFTKLSFLEFLHGMPAGTMVLSGIIITVILVVLTMVYSFEYMVRLWEKIEV